MVLDRVPLIGRIANGVTKADDVAMSEDKVITMIVAYVRLCFAPIIRVCSILCCARFRASV
eukprot:2342437-Rhodomonas_salina.2